MKHGHEALLLMDYQLGICGPGGLLGSASGLADHAAERRVVERARAVLDRARGREVPIVHVGVAFDAEFLNRNNRGPGFNRFEDNGWMIAGSPETKFVPELEPTGAEAVVFKGSVDPFVGTNLMEILLRNRTHRLVLGGTATNFVVESTARHASDMGFEVIVLEDICASYNEAMHRFAIEKTLPLFAKIESSDNWPH